jgi:hypothetical protein
MGRSSEKIIQFPRDLEGRVPSRRRVGDSPAKVLSLVFVFVAVSALAVAELFDVDLTTAGW